MLAEWSESNPQPLVVFLDEVDALIGDMLISLLRQLRSGYDNRIVKLSMEGQVLGTLSGYGKVPGKLDFVHTIALDSTGALYVSEIKNWRVQKFAAR